MALSQRAPFEIGSSILRKLSKDIRIQIWELLVADAASEREIGTQWIWEPEDHDDIIEERDIGNEEGPYHYSETRFAPDEYLKNTIPPFIAVLRGHHDQELYHEALGALFRVYPFQLHIGNMFGQYVENKLLARCRRIEFDLSDQFYFKCCWNCNMWYWRQGIWDSTYSGWSPRAASLVGKKKITLNFKGEIGRILAMGTAADIIDQFFIMHKVTFAMSFHSAENADIFSTLAGCSVDTFNTLLGCRGKLERVTTGEVATWFWENNDPSSRLCIQPDTIHPLIGFDSQSDPDYRREWADWLWDTYPKKKDEPFREVFWQFVREIEESFGD